MHDIIYVGEDITCVGWGAQIKALMEASKMAKELNNVSCEIIDLQSILPWDKTYCCGIS